MKLLHISPIVILSPVLALPSWHVSQPSSWAPPGPDDVRAPCPMLNTLANHGFLPHSGKDISETNTIDALGNALNINQTLAEFLFSKAVTTNPKPNATTFDLDNLSRHNILEHDASLSITMSPNTLSQALHVMFKSSKPNHQSLLADSRVCSRQDFYFGDDHTFNQTVFDETRSYWTDSTVDVQMAANARSARVHTSNTTNPTFSLSELGTAFGFGESAAYIIVLGDRISGTVNRTFVEYLFENERLPTELGWSKVQNQLTIEDLDDMIDRIENATDLSPEARMMARAADTHAGR
ncbi:MAG: hypothetical protein M1820_008487 [Bogoriella megaspora]|nr:MAG: hypothetical protein M1820_008487 [Bogoriella megaspora]